MQLAVQSGGLVIETRQEQKLSKRNHQKHRDPPIVCYKSRQTERYTDH